MQDEVMCGSSREQYHVSLNDKIRGMERNISSLQELIDQVKGQPAPPVPLEGAKVDAQIPSLSDVLQTGPATIHDNNMRIYDQIEELRHLLF